MLVCSPETVQELVRPNDLKESQCRLETLTTFPRCYIHEKQELFRREFSCAIAAFQNNAGYTGNDVQAFAGAWQEGLSYSRALLRYGPCYGRRVDRS